MGVPIIDADVGTAPRVDAGVVLVSNPEPGTESGLKAEGEAVRIRRSDIWDERRGENETHRSIPSCSDGTWRASFDVSRTRSRRPMRQGRQYLLPLDQQSQLL